MSDEQEARLSLATIDAPLIEVRALKYDGRLHRRWTAVLLERRDACLVLRGVFEKPVTHSLLGVVEAGTVSTEYYWTNRWYSVFEFVTPAGTLRNYYCNVNLPPVFDQQVLSFVDLDIDLLVAPNLSYQVLDEDEFEINAARFPYPDDVVARARAALGELISLVNRRQFPFPNHQ